MFIFFNGIKQRLGQYFLYEIEKKKKMLPSNIGIDFSLI